MSLLNEDFQYNYSPLSDVGAGLLFGIGYYMFNHFYRDSFESVKKTSQSSQNFSLERAKTLEEFNTIIKQKEKEENLNPFEILSKISKLDLNPDITTYNNLLNFCYKNGKFHYADRLEEEIFDFTSPVHYDICTFNILLNGIACKIDSKNVDEMKTLLEKMKKILSEIDKATNIKPNEITLNTCMEILCRAGRWEDAWIIFDNMEKKYNITPDNYSFSLIIKALRAKPDCNKLKKALKIFEIIKQRPKTTLTKNEEVIIFCLIECCFNLGDISKAELLYEEMRTFSLPISKIIYCLMIKGYGKYYFLDKALEIYNQMKKNNVFANEVIYGCILNVCVRCSDIKNAKLIYDEIKRSNYQDNLYISSTMIKAYAKAGEFISAIYVYEGIINSKNVKPNIIFFNAILDACVQCNEFQTMSDIYKKIKKYRKSIEDYPKPDLITLSTLIKGYSKINKMEKVFKIYDTLEKIHIKGEIKLDEVFFNTVLDACVRNNSIDKGLEIIKVMKLNGIVFSNVTYSIIIKLYSKDNNTRMALEILDEMKKNRVIPGLIVYTCLIQTCLKCKNFSKAIHLFEELKNIKINPDHVIYSSIVNSFLYNKKFELAYQYLFESFKYNVRLPDYIYNKYFHLLLTNYNLNKDQKLTFCEKIYSMLKTRKFEFEKKIIREIIAFNCK